MRGTFIGVEKHRQNVIGGMTGRGQYPSSLRSLVHGTRVSISFRQLGFPHGHEQHQWQHIRQYFWKLFF